MNSTNRKTWFERVKWRALLTAAFLAIVSLPVAYLTSEVQGYDGTAVTGNMCEDTDPKFGLCYTHEALAGGWPFRFLVDSYAVSPLDNLGTEDTFLPAPFFADFAVILAIFITVAVSLSSLRRLYEHTHRAAR